MLIKCSCGMSLEKKELRYHKTSDLHLTLISYYDYDDIDIFCSVKCSYCRKKVEVRKLTDHYMHNHIESMDSDEEK